MYARQRPDIISPHAILRRRDERRRHRGGSAFDTGQLPEYAAVVERFCLPSFRPFRRQEILPLPDIEVRGALRASGIERIRAGAACRASGCRRCLLRVAVRSNTDGAPFEHGVGQRALSSFRLRRARTPHATARHVMRQLWEGQHTSSKVDN